jgi:transcriptional regulator with XRE-family HTH domain
MDKQEAAIIRKKIVGVLLRNARLHAGMGVREAAKATGFSSNAISDYEFGRRDLSLPHLETFAYVYRVPMSYFLDQGLRPHGEKVAGIDELERLAQLPAEVREFMLEPGNLLYIRLAMRLSPLSAETLRSIAEGLLEITY